MSFVSRVKAEMRERETAAAILGMPVSERPVLTYAEDSYSWNQLEGYLRAVVERHGRPVVYVTADGDDPRLAEPPSGMQVFHIEQSVARFLPRIDSPVFFTTMPDLGQSYVDRPRDSVCAYAFHSLNSTHMAYRRGAFDAYDVFFCTGPYQRRELEARFTQIGKTGYELHDVGYSKLDRMKAAWEERSPTAGGRTVLLAPSWGERNLLAAIGEDLIDALVGADLAVIVRPHPAFFESIYPEGAKIIQRLAKRFEGHPRVSFERTITSETSFMDADLLITESSGSAFEYAFATERPALFIDLPPKVKNDHWREIPEEPFEVRMRSEVGVIVDPADLAGVKRAAEELLGSRPEWRERIRAAADRELFNVGRADEAGAAVIEDLCRRAQP